MVLSELLSQVVMTTYLRISIPYATAAEPQTSAFFHVVVFKPAICPAIPGDFCVIVFLWDEAPGEARAALVPARRLAGGACCM